MQVSYVPIASVIPYARNPRRNERAIALVASSLREFGWQQPIVVDSEMVVIAGHTRLEAARVLEMDTVPVHVAKDLTAEQVKAFRIADNKLAELSEWNHELLALELKDLLGADYDIEKTALSTSEIDKLLAPTEGNLLDPTMGDAADKRSSSSDLSFVIGKYRAPMTGPEFKAINAWVDTFIERTGSDAGVLPALLEVRDAGK